MEVPSKLGELFEHVAGETARMSYPGSMSRGNKPVVHKGTKAVLEGYFATMFPLREIWISGSRVAQTYEDWHQVRVIEISKAIDTHVSEHNNSEAVAAKFLNTFMHQLMKYQPCRALWPALHLPLDSRVFAALTRLQAPSLAGVRAWFSQSPYSLPYVTHLDIQRALERLVQELNDRPHAEFKIGSRIELNWLWI